MDSFTVTADFEVNGAAAGENLAGKFQPLPDQRWELRLEEPISSLPRGQITVTVQDRLGHRTQTQRMFSVGTAADERPLKVFVLAGTSNMHGANARIDSLPKELRQPRHDVLVYEKGEWAPLEAGKNLVGNEATFAQAMTRHLGEPIGILRIGVGSAAERSKGESIVNIVTQSREAGRPIVVAGILLDVSFRDGIKEESAKAYAENLPPWVTTMREEIGDASLPVVMNRAIPPVPKTPYLDLVRKAQDELTLPSFRVFNCDDVSRCRDNVHFNTAGRLEMGRRFAAAMIELMNSYEQAN